MSSGRRCLAACIFFCVCVPGVFFSGGRFFQKEEEVKKKRKRERGICSALSALKENKSLSPPPSVSSPRAHFCREHRDADTSSPPGSIRLWRGRRARGGRRRHCEAKKKRGASERRSERIFTHFLNRTEKKTRDRCRSFVLALHVCTKRAFFSATGPDIATSS